MRDALPWHVPGEPGSRKMHTSQENPVVTPALDVVGAIGFQGCPDVQWLSSVEGGMEVTQKELNKEVKKPRSGGGWVAAGTRCHENPKGCRRWVPWAWTPGVPGGPAGDAAGLPAGHSGTRGPEILPF